jgi:hypothetical protein
MLEELTTHHHAMQEDDRHASPLIVEAESNSVAKLDWHACSSIRQIL